MIITSSTLKSLFTAYSANFRKGYEKSDSHYKRFSIEIPSNTTENMYAWMGQFPEIEEWLGDKKIKNLIVHDYTIKNRDFESTVSVRQNDIEDDRYGVYAPMFRAMGEEAGNHPDSLIFELLKEGSSRACYDGQYFFDADHPGAGGKSVSNLLQPTREEDRGAPWYLMCTAKSMKPFIFQRRKDYALRSITDESDERVFMRGEFIYGVTARVNAGYGLWQMALCSTHDLTPSNYAAARAAMVGFTGDTGRKLGIVPDLLVVPYALEEKARTILACEQVAGTTNPWKGTAELLVSHWL